MSEIYSNPPRTASVDVLRQPPEPGGVVSVSDQAADSAPSAPLLEAPQDSYLDVIERKCPQQDLEPIQNYVERYAQRKRRTRPTIEYLKEIGKERKARRIESCGDWLTIHDYFRLNERRLVRANFCKNHLLCIPCAVRRGGRLLRAYSERLSVIQQQYPNLNLFLVTLTIKNRESLADAINHLAHCMRVLNHRRRNAKQGRSSTEWGKVQGWVGSREVTNGNKGKGWHPHFHAASLVDPSNPIDTERFRKEWKDISGDSDQIDVRPMIHHPDDPMRDFSEVFKYPLKFAELYSHQIIEIYELLKNKKGIYSGGLFRGVEVPKLTDDPLKDEPYIEYVYRWLEAQTYSLAAFRTFDGKDKEIAKDS